SECAGGCPSQGLRPTASLFRVSVSSSLLGGYDEPETLRHKINSDVPGVLTGDMDALFYSLCFDNTSLAHRDAVRGERHPPHLHHQTHRNSYDKCLNGISCFTLIARCARLLPPNRRTYSSLDQPAA